MYLQHTQFSQINNIVGCHRKCFPSSLASRLGQGYLQKTFEWFLMGDNKFLFHINEGGAVVAYCGGFMSEHKGEGSTSGMMQYAMSEAVWGIFRHPYLLFNKEVVSFYPLILKNFFKSFFRWKPAKKSSDATHPGSEKKIGLVVIGVDPVYRGKGYFEALMKEFEKECIKRNATKMTLSVKPTNTRAIAAYKKAGWDVAAITDNDVKMFKTILY